MGLFLCNKSGIVMNIRQLESFVNIAENLSFSETAEKMYLSQPTVSGYINSLEDELGISLFARSTKDISLTVQGEELYPEAKKIVDTVKIIENRFIKKNETDRPVVISSSSIPSRYLLSGILSEFSAKYKDVRFVVNESDSLAVVESIYNKSADIGFTGTKIMGRNCKYVKMFEDEMVVITPNNDYYSELIKKRSLDWIKGVPVILREVGSGTRREAIKIIKNMGINPDSLNIIAEMENTETIKRSVRDGMGISFISKLAVKEGISTGNVLEKQLSKDMKNRNIYMVTNSKYGLSKNSKLLVDFIKKSFIENTNKYI